MYLNLYNILKSNKVVHFNEQPYCFLFGDFLFEMGLALRNNILQVLLLEVISILSC